MQIIENKPYIEKRARIAVVLPLIAMGFLFGGVFALVTYPEWIWGTFALVAIGFILANAGNYLLEHFSKRNAYHLRVIEALKGLDDSYTLLVYKLPVPFVLIEPGGATAIVVKNQNGQIRYADGKWQHRQRLLFFHRLGGQEALGKPEEDVRDEVARLEKYLHKSLPEGVTVPVRGIALFTGNLVDAEAEGAPVPAMQANRLKEWLHGAGRWGGLPSETRRQLAAALKLSKA